MPGWRGLFSLVDLLAFAYLIPTPSTKSVRCRPRRVCAPSGRTGAAEDRAVPGTMIARPGVDGQVGTGRSPGVSGGRKPYNRAMAGGMIRQSFKGGTPRDGSVVLAKLRGLRRAWRARSRSGGVLEDAGRSPLPLWDASTLSLHRACPSSHRVQRKMAPLPSDAAVLTPSDLVVMLGPTSACSRPGGSGMDASGHTPAKRDPRATRPSPGPPHRGNPHPSIFAYPSRVIVHRGNASSSRSDATAETAERRGRAGKACSGCLLLLFGGQGPARMESTASSRAARIESAPDDLGSTVTRPARVRKTFDFGGGGFLDVRGLAPLPLAPATFRRMTSSAWSRVSSPATIRPAVSRRSCSSSWARPGARVLGISPESTWSRSSGSRRHRSSGPSRLRPG